jgi:hypothetical protein
MRNRVLFAGVLRVGAGPGAGQWRRGRMDGRPALVRERRARLFRAVRLHAAYRDALWKQSLGVVMQGRGRRRA